MKPPFSFYGLIPLLTCFLLVADSRQDRLPLGSSPHRFDLGKIEANQICESKTGTIVNIPLLVEAAADADLIVVGEFHDNYGCHRFQRDLIEALVKKYKRIIVGFEFFRRSDNEALEQWRNGRISEAELIRQTGWYKKTAYNYGFTRTIMEVIQQYGVRTIGLNVSRDILRKVSRNGFDSLSKGEKKLFPSIRISNPEHRYLIKTVFGDFATQVPFWFENVYTAQTCWDVVMAESMRKILARKEYREYKGVIIAGSLHVAYGLGIPFRFKRASGRSKILTVMPVLIPSKDEKPEEEEHPMKKMFAKNLPPAAVFSRGIGDYIFSVIQSDPPHFPELGLSCKKINDAIRITAINKKGLAEKYGLKKGDIITGADGKKLDSLEQLRRLLAEKKWGDSIRLQLDRKIELKKEDDRLP